MTHCHAKLCRAYVVLTSITPTPLRPLSIVTPAAAHETLRKMQVKDATNGAPEDHKNIRILQTAISGTARMLGLGDIV